MTDFGAWVRDLIVGIVTGIKQKNAQTGWFVRSSFRFGRISSVAEGFEPWSSTRYFAVRPPA